MTGKFATASAITVVSITILLGARGFAQSTPATDAAPQTTTAPDAQQAPAQPQDTPPANTPPAGTPPAGAQQPSAQANGTQATAADQEPADEVSTSRRTKPKDFKNWNYNVGIGAELNSGTTRTFVRQGGYQGSVGVARNANKYLGLRFDAIVADLPLRQTALSLAQAGSASSYFFGFTLDPVINLPVTKDWGGYVLFGPGYYHRGGSLSSDNAFPGSSCNAFYKWWGACSSVSLPLSSSFKNSSQNDFGYNFGAGVTRKAPSGVEVYVEVRFIHGSGNSTTTDVRPVTVGVRW